MPGRLNFLTWKMHITKVRKPSSWHFGKQVSQCVLKSWKGLADRYSALLNTFSKEKLDFIGAVETKLHRVSLQEKFRSSNWLEVSWKTQFFT
jgi:hypothetical protein